MRVRTCLCVCVCVCARVSACVCASVCVCMHASQYVRVYSMVILFWGTSSNLFLVIFELVYNYAVP